MVLATIAALALLMSASGWIALRRVRGSLPSAAVGASPRSGPPGVARSLTHTGDVTVETPKPEAIEPVEYCGLGTVRLPADDLLAQFEYLAAQSADLEARWLSALGGSPDSRARAAYLYMVAATPADLVQGAPPGSVEGVRGPAREALARLATETSDPPVYAMAVQACGFYGGPATSGPSACDAITAQGWARIDADNAVPLLVTAGQAFAERDRAAMDVAFSQAVQAHRVDSYSEALAQFSEHDIPADATPLQRYYLLTMLQGYEATWGQLHHSAALHYCTPAALTDPDIRHRCDQLATLLATSGARVSDVRTAATLARVLGWPAERITALRDEGDAEASVLAQEKAPRFGCENVRAASAAIVEAIHQGTRFAARDAVERSGMSMSEAGAHFRTTLQARRDLAAKGVSGAR